MRAFLSDALALAGLAVLTIGCWWLAPWFGMVVLGLGLFATAWVIDPPKRPERPSLEEELAIEPDAPRSAVAPPPGLDWNPQ